MTELKYAKDINLLEFDLGCLSRIIEIERQAKISIGNILGRMKREDISVVDLNDAIYEAKEIVLKRLTYNN